MRSREAGNRLVGFVTSSNDFELRQSILQPLLAGSGDLRMIDVQGRKVLEALQPFQAGIRHRRMPQAERRQAAQVFQRNEPGVRNLRVIDVKMCRTF